MRQGYQLFMIIICFFLVISCRIRPFCTEIQQWSGLPVSKTSEGLVFFKTGIVQEKCLLTAAPAVSLSGRVCSRVNLIDYSILYGTIHW